MKLVARTLSVIFALLAVAAAAVGIYIAATYTGEAPILVKPSEEARELTRDLLAAVSAGEYEKASTMILGQPDLGVDREAADPVGVVLWNAYQESLEYTPVGDCFSTKAGLAQKYTVRYLDLETVMSTLGDRSKKLLEDRVAKAENVSEVYDQNNEYREDVVLEVLQEAAKDALRENAAYLSWEFTVNLVFRDEQWWAVADSDLLKAISGGLAG